MPSSFANVLYIDTSVLKHHQFDLHSPAFKALGVLISEGSARLLTSAITVGERHKHIKAHVTVTAI